VRGHRQHGRKRDQNDECFRASANHDHKHNNTPADLLLLRGFLDGVVTFGVEAKQIP